MKKVISMVLIISMLLSVFPSLVVRADNEADYGSDYLYGVDPLPEISIQKLNFCEAKDSIKVSVDYDFEKAGNYEKIYFCMYVYDYQTSQWSMAGGWQESNLFIWEPDANDNYAVVVYAGSRIGNREIIKFDECWQQVNRPQMSPKVIGDCAMPTSDGLLFGCASEVTNKESGYFTTCYIWSHEKQSWIAQAAYEASNCAWYKVSGLPKGTYMMYTCTEKTMENGQKRKLSCSYYLFAI